MDERELLEHYRPWLFMAARNMLPERYQRHVEDLAQEGWIALWRARPDRYDAPVDYLLKQAAVRRMWVVLDTFKREGGNAKGRGVPPAVDVQHSDFSEPDLWPELLMDPEQVELAYHHGEIATALSELGAREREYVVLRFWGDLASRELTGHFGYNPSSLWRNARSKLADRLAHLEDKV